MSSRLGIVRVMSRCWPDVSMSCIRGGECAWYPVRDLLTDGLVSLWSGSPVISSVVSRMEILEEVVGVSPEAVHMDWSRGKSGIEVCSWRVGLDCPSFGSPVRCLLRIVLSARVLTHE